MTDCDKTLTPKELYQVIIGRFFNILVLYLCISIFIANAEHLTLCRFPPKAPSFVDFGEVCFHSVCEQKVDLINPLPTFVRVQFEVDCFELQGSSPLSHMLPPVSHNSVNLTFQSNKLGQFYRLVQFYTLDVL